MAPSNVTTSNPLTWRPTAPLSPAMAASNATASNPPTYTPTPRPYPQQWTSPYPIRQLVHPPALITSNGSQQRHHIQSAPSNGTPAMKPSNGSHQRRHVQSTNVYTLPLFPAMAPSTTSNPQLVLGTQQWQPVTAPRPIHRQVTSMQPFCARAVNPIRSFYRRPA